jgi:hypothetical protein
MSESTCREAMYQFCEDIIAVFGEYYLAEPKDDTARLLSINKSREFLNMLGSIDCMHWQGRTILLVGKGSSKGKRRGAPLYWWLLPHRIFGFGTHSLVWQDQIMISMCCIALWYFLGLLTRVNSTNVLVEGLRIGEIGRRMDSKVKSVKQGVYRK